MTQNKKTTKTSKSPKATAAKAESSVVATKRTKKIVADQRTRRTHSKPAANRTATQEMPCPTTFDDVRNAVLIISLLFNLFFLVTWVTLQVTTQYDIELSQMLFSR